MPLAIVIFSVLLPNLASSADRFNYDDLDRLSEANDGGSNTTTYSYDAVGNILSVQSGAATAVPPSIATISPSVVALGQAQLTVITGAGLGGAVVKTDNPGVLVGNVYAVSNKITVTLTAGFDARLGATIVTVSTPKGFASAAINVNAAAPVLSSLNPASGPPTRLVEVYGSGFSTTAANNAVSFGAINAPTLSATNSRLLTQVPLGASSGNVVVTTNGMNSNGLAFSVTSGGPAPIFTNIMPAVSSMSGGLFVTVTGNNFSADTKVKIGGRLLTNQLVVSSETITGTAPAAVLPGFVDLLVSSVNGDAFAPAAFTYISGENQKLLQIDPASGAPTNTWVSLLFSRPLDRATITTSSVALADNSGSPVSGTFSYKAGDQALFFKPVTSLAASAVYKVTVSQGIKSVDGVPLNAPYKGFFTTGNGADTTSPAVTVQPANNAVNIPYNAKITFAFSEPINPVSLNAESVSIENGGFVRQGSFALSEDRRSAIFTPFSPFIPNSQVKITLTPNVIDSAGNSLVGSSGVGTNVTSVFTTATNADILPPRVISVTPADNATGASVNSVISITLSEPIDASTVNNSSFMVSVGGVALAGALNVDAGNSVITFKPAGALPSLTQVEISANSGIRDLAGNGLISSFVSRFTTQSGADIYRPSIVTYSPGATQGGIPLSARVEVVFDEAIDASRLNGQSVFARDGSTWEQIGGTLTVRADQKGLVFTPNVPWAPNKHYYLSIGIDTPIYDMAGNPLLNAVNYSVFYTGTALSDAQAPQVVAVHPKDGSGAFPLNGIVELQFSEPVAPTSVSDQSIVVSSAGVPVAGEVGFRDNNTIVTFKPANLLQWKASTAYDVQVTANVRDLSGNAATAFNSVFTTGTAADSTKPTLVSVVPANNGTIDPNQPATFSVTFSEAINPLSLASSISVWRNSYYYSREVGMARTYSLSADQKVLTVQADKPLVAGRYVVLELNNTLRDTAGNTLAACFPCSWVNTQWAAPADAATVFDQASVLVNPTSLYADG